MAGSRAVRELPGAAISVAILALVAVAPPAGAAADGMPETLRGHGGPIMGLAADPETGRMLTASFDYAVMLWSLSGEAGAVERRLIGHNAAVNDVAFVPGTARAVSVGDDGAAIVWDLESGRALTSIRDTGDKVLDVAVSSDGRLAAIARWDDTARLIDLATFEETARLEGHRGNVNSIAFDPLDGDTVYTGSYDGTIRSWDVATGVERRIVHEHGWGVNVVVTLPGTLVFGGLDGTLARIALAGGAVTELMRSDRPVLSLAVSEDGGRLAAGFGDGRIVVYDTQGWRELEVFEDPYGPVWGLAFADRGGDALYYAGLDDHASFWRVEPRDPFEQPTSHYPRRFQVTGDMSLGERQFQRRCSVCHTLSPDDANRAGPTLYRLFGREAGSVPGYPYSEGLRNSDIVWTEETVARLFDHGPDVVTPGTKMPIQRLKDAAERNALIAYLKVATAPRRGDSPATASQSREEDR